MTKKKMPRKPSAKPVIYVHGKGHGQVSKEQVKDLLDLGLPLYSRLGTGGTTQTKHGYDQPAQLLAELTGLLPGRPVIFLRAGLLPSQFLLDQLNRLIERAEQPLVLSLLSNAEIAVNPFAGLSAPSNHSAHDLASLVNLLGPGNLHTLSDWVDHFIFLSSETAERLADNTCRGTLLQRLLAAGGKFQVPDHLFLHDPDRPVFEKHELEPHESLYPPSFSELSARLQAWLNAGIRVVPTTRSTVKTATLHITHSWGGGVAQWISSFIETDKRNTHFQLRSELTQSNRSYGQRLSLYIGNELRCPVASWWMHPPIESVNDTDTAYQEILSDICRRYMIGRVFVSSLIGHSLDVLRTGLPTVHILHDHFPVWPLLNVNPEPYISDDNGVNLGKALSEHQNSRNFTDKDALAWSDIQRSYTGAIREFNVRIAAPGQWVLDLQNRLEPGFAKFDSKVIPHGFPALSDLKPVLPRPRDDRRLRMVILGRMQEGKGQKLLTAALPELAKYVQVYLLGTGKPGEAFFGVSGVDVVLKYEREELQTLLTKIGPDFAALLSIVPETFSYTLSELQQFEIPVVATRVGSFPERITHGETGWLVDTDPAAVVRQVAAICSQPGLIDLVRQRLASMTVNTPRVMVNAYNRYCPPAKTARPFAASEITTLQVQWAASDFQRSQTENELSFAQFEQKNLLKEIKLRSDWAQRASDDLKQEQKNRKKWINKLQAEIDRLTKEFEEKSAWALQLNENLEQEQQNREKWVNNLQTEIDRLTKEFEEKSAWALQLSEELEQEQQNREKWVGLLEADISNLHSIVAGLRSELEQTGLLLNTARIELSNKNDRLSQLETEYQTIAEERALILQSTSWKLTRPLRAARRVAKNFMLARAWNPLRWPWILSNLVRNLHTLGLARTIRRLQYTGGEAIAKPRFDIKTEPVTDLPPLFSFPVLAQPDVSIVIPVYNNWEYTAACLHSLLQAKGKYSLEIIVVDDHSTDETAQQLRRIGGIKHFKNDQNLGFVGSCNRGASHARGEFLVLLNNDTQVVDGWLDELIDTFKQQPDAGLVGARLVYPDGTLQESGGMIFNDGSGWNYGRGDDAERPEYLFLRETDYCSGACIALKTAYFHQLGDLDERYSPAYYEDTDLAFKVRESGLKVYIQPSSVIIHHEGITSGTDTSSGTKKYQLINQKKFLDRWRAELESQPQPIAGPDDRAALRKASQHHSKGRVLFIDATTPEPDQDSGSVRLTNLLRICRGLGYGVTFFADNRAYMGRYTTDLQKAGIEVLYHPWLDSLSDFFQERGNEYDYVFISRHYVAINYISLLKRHCPKAAFIFDTVDLHYLREQRLAELEKSKTLKAASRQTRRSELSVIKAADVTLVVSSVEKDVLAKDAPDETVHILSNIHHVAGRGKGFSERRDIFFIGGYQHPPNIDAACWFVNDIWPLIHEQIPDMRFHLIGSKAPEEVLSLEGDGVVFHGFVESLDPFLDDCRLAVAPLRYGAGVKGKVNMSMAHGQPMVVTPAAGEGTFAEHEREFLVARDAESFAREVVRLYQDENLWYKLSDASIKNVETHFSIKAARESVISLFDSLAR